MIPAHLFFAEQADDSRRWSRKVVLGGLVGEEMEVEGSDVIVLQERFGEKGEVLAEVNPRWRPSGMFVGGFDYWIGL